MLLQRSTGLMMGLGLPALVLSGGGPAALAEMAAMAAGVGVPAGAPAEVVATATGQEQAQPQLPRSVLFVVPHFHWDLAYYQTEAQELHLGVDLLEQYLGLARVDPGFRFVIDQVPLMQALFERDPAAGAQLRELVRSGRVEITGGLYVQPDENLPSGEALVRQGIYGQRWIAQTFGPSVRAENVWDIDSFGHVAGLPQIARHVGLNRLVFSYARTDIHQPEVRDFWWRGADGSQLQANVLYRHYNNGLRLGRGAVYDQGEQFARVEEAFREQEAFHGGPGLFLLVDGDDNTPPPYFLTRLAKEWNAAHPDRQLVVALPREYFAALSARRGQAAAWPEVRDEFQVNWNGYFSSRITDKLLNRRLEYGLLAAERWASLACLVVGRAAAFPRDRLDAAWVGLLTNQFHDYLPGTTVDPARAAFDRRAQEVGQEAANVQDSALATLARAGGLEPAAGSHTEPATAPTTFAVWNPLPWARSALVPVPVAPSWGEPFALVDERGRELAYQLVSGASGSGAADPSGLLGSATTARPQTAWVRLDDLPALGYGLVRVVSGRAPAVDPGEKPVDLDYSGHGSGIRLAAGPNAQVRLTASGSLASLQVDGRELIDTNASLPLGALGLQTDTGDVYAYSTLAKVFQDGAGMSRATSEDPGVHWQVRVWQGPLFTRIVSVGSLALPDQAESAVEREAWIDRASGRVDFRTTVQWRGKDQDLYTVFPIAGDQRTDSLPYGWIQRGYGSWPIQDWLDFGTEQQGLTLVTQGLSDTFRSFLAQTTIHLTLLRAVGRIHSTDTPLAQMLGTHTFRYAVVPRRGALEPLAAFRLGQEFNNEPVVMPLTAAPVTGRPWLTAADEVAIPSEPVGSLLPGVSPITSSTNAILTAIYLDPEPQLSRGAPGPLEVDGPDDVALVLRGLAGAEGGPVVLQWTTGPWLDRFAFDQAYQANALGDRVGGGSRVMTPGQAAESASVGDSSRIAVNRSSTGVSLQIAVRPGELFTIRIPLRRDR